MSSKQQHSIKQCLEVIGVTVAELSECTSVQEEFTRIKKLYFRRVLVAHPDKGGDPDEFRAVQTSFEVLRELFDRGRIADSFVSSSSAKESTAGVYEETYQDFGSMPTPSWEYYYSAAEEAVPTYRVELAKSARSACKQKGKAKKCYSAIIDKGDIRIGSMLMETGSYGRWVHLNCWRVPSKVWLGLPDSNPDPSTCACSDPLRFEAALLGMNEVLLCGFSELPKEDRMRIVTYVMDKDNWARLTMRKDQPAGSTTSSSSNGNSNGNVKTEAGAMVAHSGGDQQNGRTLVSNRDTAQSSFMIPVPGRNGALANALEGKTVVCTGTFPELGGGAGLNLGKDKVKALVASFGGRITGSVSGKTDILLVGKDPGYSKVSQARERGVQLMGLRDLALGLSSEGALALADIKPMKIKKFSSGYRKNSLALEASPDDLRVAQGLVDIDPELLNKSKSKKGAVVKKKTKKRPAPVKVENYDDVTCDACGAECTEQSWYVKETGSDFCDHCNPGEGATRQSNGADILSIGNQATPNNVKAGALVDYRPPKKQKISKKA